MAWSWSGRRSGTTGRSRRSAVRCAPTTRGPARCAGAGIRFPRDSDPAPATWRGRYAHPTGAANVWSVMPRTRARPRLRADQQPQPGLLRRRADRRQSLRELRVALRASTGRSSWAFQTSTTISGTTTTRSARAVDRHAGRQVACPRWWSGDEDGTPLRAATARRARPLFPSRSVGSRRARCRRARLADAAVPNSPPGLGAVTAHGRRRLGHHASRT